LDVSSQVALCNRHGSLVLLGALAFALDVGCPFGSLSGGSVPSFDLHVGAGGCCAAEAEQEEREARGLQ
jgi:hypothetical protein